MKLKSDGSIKSIHAASTDSKISRPLIGTPIHAGFPSPATDYMEGNLDLNDYVVKHKASTFFVKVDGFSMINAGIFPDDILVVDRSLEATHNRVIIAIVNGELTVKRLQIIGEEYWLVPENDEFQPIRVTEESEFFVWGVVTFVVHKL